MTNLIQDLKKYIPNLVIFAAFLMLITCMDLANHYLLNERYVFRFEALFQRGYAFTAIIILLASFAGRYVFILFFVALVFVSTFQLISFEYFGSYITPFQILHFFPDFGLIMASLFDVFHEVVPILSLTIFSAIFLILLLRPLLKKRIASLTASIALIALLIFDFSLTFTVLERSQEKLLERKSQILTPRFNNLGVVNGYRSFRFLMVGVLPTLLNGDLPSVEPLPLAQKVSTPKVNVVLIIGETVRASNMSILGYNKQTTPKLDAMDDLLARTVYSAGTMTRTSFAGLFNRLNGAGLGRSNGQAGNCLNRLAKLNGFKTQFLYSYGQGAAETLLPFMCPGSVDTVASLEAGADNPDDPDRNLFTALTKIDLDQPNFITIMPKGAHSPYGVRSPSSFKKFDNEYDNAILFTDFTISRIIKHLSDNTNLPTYVVYTGDQGELLKGEAKHRGHGWFHREVVHVPFLYYEINAPTKDKRQQAENVRSHFDISTLITNLLGYGIKVSNDHNRSIHINGSDVSGLAGQLILSLEGSKVVNVKAIKTLDAGPTPQSMQISQP